MKKRNLLKNLSRFVFCCFPNKRVISCLDKCVHKALRGDMGSFWHNRCFCLRVFTTEINAEKKNFSRARLFFEFLTYLLFIRDHGKDREEWFWLNAVWNYRVFSTEWLSKKNPLSSDLNKSVNFWHKVIWVKRK